MANGTSKYCSRDCGVANAKERVLKNHQHLLQKSSIIQSASTTSSPNTPPTSSSNNNINNTINNNINNNNNNNNVTLASSTSNNNISLPNTSSPPQNSTDPTQKLLSSSNSEDINRLKFISQKRQEVEEKLKNIEKKSSEFEKAILLSKLKLESSIESCSPKVYNSNNQNDESNLNSNNNNNNKEQLCIYPIKESISGFCGEFQCSKHIGWEKKRRETFTKEQNFHTKTLRELSLEEKQIHQRISRRNKISQQNTDPILEV